jgi:hypothetical protein
VLRLALVGLAVVVTILVVLSLLPQRPRVIPEATIRLEQARVTLYPQADPEAIWFFGARDVAYEPNTRATTLFQIEEGERTVAGETDFTLVSDLVTIDQDDNLRSERMFVHLVEANWDLDMQSKNGRTVLIDQRNGKFEIPRLFYTGDGLENNLAETVRMNFDLTDYEADCDGAACYNEFKDQTTQ